MRPALLLLAAVVASDALRAPQTRAQPPRRAARRAATASAAAPPPPTKFIVVTGGVISGIGKGVTASSIGVCMKMLGARVTAVKIDPYLNVDAGTMSPYEHGEAPRLASGSQVIRRHGEM